MSVGNGKKVLLKKVSGQISSGFYAVMGALDVSTLLVNDDYSTPAPLRRV